jgi:hypothetical protein
MEAFSFEQSKDINYPSIAGPGDHSLAIMQSGYNLSSSKEFTDITFINNKRSGSAFNSYRLKSHAGRLIISMNANDTYNRRLFLVKNKRLL